MCSFKKKKKLKNWQDQAVVRMRSNMTSYTLLEIIQNYTAIVENDSAVSHEIKNTHLPHVPATQLLGIYPR